MASLQSAGTTLVTATSALRSQSTDAISSTINSLLSQIHGPAESQRIDTLRAERETSTINGVVIGILSSFGSAFIVALIFLVVYFLRYTTRGRIVLGRLGRPGEWDDEMGFAREEAEALEVMNEGERAEYLRAKGMLLISPSVV
jgi:hypothetical protein